MIWPAIHVREADSHLLIFNKVELFDKLNQAVRNKMEKEFEKVCFEKMREKTFEGSSFEKNRKACTAKRVCK